MKDKDLQRSRDRALYNLYCAAIRTRRFRNMHEAAEWVRKQPAPRFYLSPEKLVEYLGLLLNGKSLIAFNTISRRRIWELFDRYEEYVNTHDCAGMSRERICEIIVEEPAPEFYLCHELTIKILRREAKRAADELRKRHCR